MTGTILIVGLGNPGLAYADTRHNAGFKVIDALARELGANYWKNLGGAILAEVNYHGHRLVLAKPQSFMNSSGRPVRNLFRLYEFEEADLQSLIVVHDELDLPDGALKLKLGGRHGGHRGVLSIIENVGADFVRLRIGVGRPPGQMTAIDYVLHRLGTAQLEELEVSVQQAVPMALAVIDDGLQAAMNRFNQS